MKRGINYLFIFLLIISLAVVSSQNIEITPGGQSPTDEENIIQENTSNTNPPIDQETSPIDSKEQQYEDVKGKIDSITNVIDPDTGEVNKTTLNLGLSKAEQRIAIINQWLANNASWLRFVLGMVPAISWIFAWNIFFILLFFTHIVLNAATIFPFFEEEINARLFGTSIFILMLVLRVFVAFSGLAYSLSDTFFNYVLPYGIIIAVILLILLIVVLVLLLIFAPTIFASIMRIIGRLAGKKMISSAERKAGGGNLHKIIKETRELNKRQRQLVKEQEAFNKGSYNTAA